MKARELLFGRGGYPALLALLVGSGLALVLSMPWAGRVADFFLFPWRPTPVAFFFSLALLGAIHAMNRGAAAEPLPRIQRKQLHSLPLQVGFAHALVLPHVAICTVLVPARHAGLLWMAWGYAALVSVVLAVIAFRIAIRCFRRAHHPFFRLLLAACAYELLPVPFVLAPGPFRRIALVSPVVALWGMLSTGQPWDALLVSFLVPLILALILFLATQRQLTGEAHGLR